MDSQDGRQDIEEEQGGPQNDRKEPRRGVVQADKVMKHKNIERSHQRLRSISLFINTKHAPGFTYFVPCIRIVTLSLIPAEEAMNCCFSTSSS